jgi:hypothetical protein
MITQSCYDATALAGFPKDKTDKVLRTARAAGALRSFKGNWHHSLTMHDMQDAFVIVDASSHYLEQLPALRHPYIIMDEKTHKASIFLDARTMLTEDKVTQEYILRGGSRVDFFMLMMRVSLERMWLDKRQLELRSASSVPAIIFARWVSSTLAQRYMLDPREQESIEIISGYYYYGQFSDAKPDDLDKIVGYLSRHMGLEAKRCYEVLDKIKDDIKGVNAFCTVLAEVTESIRLKDFNAGHLFTALGMSYFGMMGKELVAVALEHPPTWIAMLSYAVTDAMYRKSVIGTMMERGSMRQKSKDFLMAIDQLIYTNSVTA